MKHGDDNEIEIRIRKFAIVDGISVSAMLGGKSYEIICNFML